MKIKPWFIILAGFIIVIMICITILDNMFLISSGSIIRKFQKNQDMFEDVVKELSLEKNEVYITKSGDQFSINIYEDIDGKTNVTEVKQEDFYKYEKSMNLMKKFNLLHISNRYGNISFQFTATINFGQFIVKMGDEEKYKWGHHILNIENLGDIWYYAETK